MRLDIEQWDLSETHRHYITEGFALTARKNPIGRHRDQTPEAMELTDREEDIAVRVFAITAITAATLWPRGLEVHVELPEHWDEVHPAVTELLGRLANADEVHIFPSPQNPGQY